MIWLAMFIMFVEVFCSMLHPNWDYTSQLYKCYFMIIESYPNPWGLLITAHIYIIYIWILVTSLCTHIINPQKDRTVIQPLLLVEASRVKAPRYEELLKLEPAAFVQSKAGNSGSSNPVRRSMGMTTDDEQWKNWFRMLTHTTKAQYMPYLISWWLEHGFYDFLYIWNGIIIPTDEVHHFSDGQVNYQPDYD